MDFQCIILRIETKKESRLIQELCFKKNISWGGDKTFFDDFNCYYAIVPNNVGNYPKGIYINTGNINVDLMKISNGKIYNVDNEYDLILIKSYILHGFFYPSYKPKRIVRKI